VATTATRDQCCKTSSRPENVSGNIFIHIFLQISTQKQDNFM
jgi:hypothetical protein